MSASISKSVLGSAPQASALPESLPDWVRELSHAYMSGTTCQFVLHGNVYDLVSLPGNGESRYIPLADFLANQIFGKWNLVLLYDLSRGLRPLAGANSARLRDMVDLFNDRLGEVKSLPRDPNSVLLLLDRFFEKLLVESADLSRTLSVAILIDYAQYVAPTAPPGGTSRELGTSLVTLLNWAQSPYLKRINAAFILITEKLSDLSPRLVRNPHVLSIEIPFPDESQRKEFIEWTVGNTDFASRCEFTAEQLGRLSAGLTLLNLEVLLRQALRSGRRIDAGRFKAFKKEMIERECQGFLEFQEPSYNLDMVVGHAEAKNCLKSDALLLQQGHLKAVPMGYLICGPVGTGKTFLAECYAGSVGLPVVKLLNFRSKYVGETEGNLEKILRVLRAMGPVAVIIDEADAAVGDREQGGDSGTSSRVFSMIASQMGDTRYRGRIIWFLLTCRPDLLPIDLKRQGRAEVHIPLFYPENKEEINQMFLVQARRVGATLNAEAIPAVPEGLKLSGADIEGIVTRARRDCLLQGHSTLNPESLGKVIASFIPSCDTLEKEMQELAAILECTDISFLTVELREKARQPGFREKLKDRMHAIRSILENP